MYDVKFHNESIVHKVSKNEMKHMALDPPDHFDSNMAYIVACSYADMFVRSSRNFRGNRRLFDKMSEYIEIYAQTYSVHNMFPYIKEMQQLSDALFESGIRHHWISKIAQEKNDKRYLITDNDKCDKVEFENMKIPLILLGIGGFLAFLGFVAEHVARLIIMRRMNRVRPFKTTSKKQQIRKIITNIFAKFHR
jgi:hypothetical protein